ncbi:uncharacterized protein LOC105422467 [Pogonomyrmex barbatus]|uniref:Uncharacterized protein LOC105422467 n=1 Tax=Pogonomyrmex barbatus TaxID=144034 RepID=A0A6I9VTV0_9HYME|nr:uncharacterized protein LOC105422467 [Pogonomyrmex barbatus]
MADIVCHRCNKIIDDKYGIGASIRCDDTCGKLIHYNCTQDEDFHFSNIFDGSKQFYCVNCTNLKAVVPLLLLLWLKKNVRMESQSQLQNRMTLRNLLDNLILFEVSLVDTNIH